MYEGCHWRYWQQHTVVLGPPLSQAESQQISALKRAMSQSSRSSYAMPSLPLNRQQHTTVLGPTLSQARHDRRDARLRTSTATKPLTNPMLPKTAVCGVCVEMCGQLPAAYVARGPSPPRDVDKEKKPLTNPRQLSAACVWPTACSVRSLGPVAASRRLKLHGDTLVRIKRCSTSSPGCSRASPTATSWLFRTSWRHARPC